LGGFELGKTSEVLYNRLSHLDLSQSANFKNLNCSNNTLLSLNIKNGSTEYNKNSPGRDSYFFFRGNPNLKYICCDNDELYDMVELVNEHGYKNVSINSYCSFTPGGQSYSINGQVRLSLDGTCDSSTSSNYPNLKFNVSNGNSIGAIMVANQTGVYNLPLIAGTYTVTPVLPNKYYSIDPAELKVTLPVNGRNCIQQFCVVPNGNHKDVDVIITPITTARPGFDNAQYKISYSNKGNQEVSGQVSFAYDEAKMDFISADKSPDLNNNAGNLTWAYNALKPFESRSVLVTLKTNAPTATPAVNAGDELGFTAVINPITGDETPADNTFKFKQTVRNAMDPNEKICLQGSKITPEMVGQDVHYTIKFENMGTADAVNIVVKDMIDTTKFDINSLQVLDSSHQFVTKISDTNKVEFIFENINLPFTQPASQGYVNFKIKTLPSLKVGDELKNTADIFFDYNFPIQTNTAKTIVAVEEALGLNEVEKAVDFSIYPNPATSVLNIISQEDIHKIEILDVQGRLIQSSQISSPKINVEALPKGTYLLRTKLKNKIQTLKFIKD
jgi:uncharacterized repeat protein (TIGR01451 family)